MSEKRSAKVLIVEDSPSQAAIIATVVKQAGHQASVYSHLPMGITNVLKVEQPDLVLLDLRLLDSDGNAVGDGFQICREIKRSPLKVPVVVVSAEGDSDACEWAVLQGADAYLQKPFAVDDLTSIIEQVLQQKEKGSCES